MDFIFTISEISRVATAIFKANKSKKIWAFYAPMGAGKTTFINALCNVWQVKTNISSPTFAIINEYNSAIVGDIYHMDWYRLKDEQEAIHTGVEDALHSGNLCLVEWPEKAEKLLDEHTLKIYIEVLDENTRRIYTPQEDDDND